MADIKHKSGAAKKAGAGKPKPPVKKKKKAGKGTPDKLLHASALAARMSEIAKQYVADLEAAGKTLDDVGGSSAVVDAVKAVLPRPNRFATRTGPVFTTGQLQRLLPGTTGKKVVDQAVRNRIEAGTLVAAKTADGRWVYPAFQFTVRPGRLVVRDDVTALWQLLPYDEDRLDRWTLIGWLTGARRDLDGASPLEWLDEHGLDDALRRAAGQVRRRAAA